MSNDLHLRRSECIRSRSKIPDGDLDHPKDQEQLNDLGRSRSRLRSLPNSVPGRSGLTVEWPK